MLSHYCFFLSLISSFKIGRELGLQLRILSEHLVIHLPLCHEWHSLAFFEPKLLALLFDEFAQIPHPLIFFLMVLLPGIFHLVVARWNTANQCDVPLAQNLHITSQYTSA